MSEQKALLKVLGLKPNRVLGEHHSCTKLWTVVSAEMDIGVTKLEKSVPYML